MTVKELYELAKSYMFEKKTSKVYDDYYMPWINGLLAENFDLNNAIRESKGEDPLDDRVYVSSDTDTIPYEPEMCYEILPYGLAKFFFIDDDLSKFNIFDTEYINAKMRYMPMKEVSIVDVYAQGE